MLKIRFVSTLQAVINKKLLGNAINAYWWMRSKFIGYEIILHSFVHTATFIAKENYVFCVPNQSSTIPRPLPTLIDKTKNYHLNRH